MTIPVITIAREFGSGGREIGVKLADRLGIPFYDKELLKLAAEKGGLHEDFVAANDERAPQFMAPSFGRVMIDTFYQPSFSDTIFIEQTKIMKELAAKGPCVIVGRCADYVLKDSSFKIFVSAGMDFKIAHKHLVAPEKADLSDAEMEKIINDIEKRRAKYYEHYTGYKKGIARNYDLCIKTDMIGIDGAVDMILSLFKEAK